MLDEPLGLKKFEGLYFECGVIFFVKFYEKFFDQFVSQVKSPRTPKRIYVLG